MHLKPSVLFVGAFPRDGSQVFGGMVTSCKALLATDLPERVNLDLFDSTQISNPPPPLLVRTFLAMLRVVRFVWRFERRRPQAVILFAALGGSILEKGAMARYARLRGVPSLIFPRAGYIVDACRDSGFTRGWARIAFRGASKIVCQSEVWRDFAVHTLGFDPNDVVVIRNWTANPALLRIGAARRPSSASPVRLLFVGWLERDKGVLELIEACKILGQPGDFTLQLVGDGHAAVEARDLVARLDLQEVVEFRGWLETAALHESLRAADVFILPSWAEGLPNAMVEAMSARMAVLVTAVGAIPEVIFDRQNGMLVRPRDPAALARALAEIVNDVKLRHRLADEAFEVAKREFTPEAAVERLVALIGSVVSPVAPLKIQD